MTLIRLLLVVTRRRSLIVPSTLLWLIDPSALLWLIVPSTLLRLLVLVPPALRWRLLVLVPSALVLLVVAALLVVVTAVLGMLALVPPALLLGLLVLVPPAAATAVLPTARLVASALVAVTTATALVVPSSNAASVVVRRPLGLLPLHALLFFLLLLLLAHVFHTFLVVLLLQVRQLVLLHRLLEKCAQRVHAFEILSPQSVAIRSDPKRKGLAKAFRVEQAKVPGVLAGMDRHEAVVKTAGRLGVAGLQHAEHLALFSLNVLSVGL